MLSVGRGELSTEGLAPGAPISADNLVLKQQGQRGEVEKGREHMLGDCEERNDFQLLGLCPSWVCSLSNYLSFSMCFPWKD